MCKRAQHLPAHVHPPFPSFTWVMTTQANPPSAAYAYGYVQNAHTDRQMQLKMGLPTHRGRYRPHYPRSTTKSPPAHDKKHMETVDYRFQESPTRPYVPRRGGCSTSQGRGAQHATAARVLVPTSPPAVATAYTTYRCPGVSDDDGDKKSRITIDALPATATTHSPVKVRRLGLLLSALRRPCGLSKVG
ncbi:hypothetical protein BJV78DRAFT_1230334 [Lactifluus subvellereus]|nr:hypothetical protein BJV78DRAFT_1230334 [Lactifluus subvellereus]